MCAYYSIVYAKIKDFCNFDRNNLHILVKKNKKALIMSLSRNWRNLSISTLPKNIFMYNNKIKSKSCDFSSYLYLFLGGWLSY